MSEIEQQSHPAKTFFGYLLLIVGGFVLLTAGLCGGYCVILFLIEGGDAEVFLMILLFAGVPLLIGGIMYFCGKALLRSRNGLDGEKTSGDTSEP